MDIVTISTIGLYAFSIIVFLIFARFTSKLIKQHNDITPLLFEFEEADKKKKASEN